MAAWVINCRSQGVPELSMDGLLHGCWRLFGWAISVRTVPPKPPSRRLSTSCRLLQGLTEHASHIVATKFHVQQQGTSYLIHNLYSRGERLYLASQSRCTASPTATTSQSREGINPAIFNANCQIIILRPAIYIKASVVLSIVVFIPLHHLASCHSLSGIRTVCACGVLQPGSHSLPPAETCPSHTPERP